MMTKWKNEKITNLGISELGRDNTESGVKSIQGFLSGTQEQENHQYFFSNFFNEIKTMNKIFFEVLCKTARRGVPMWC